MGPQLWQNGFKEHLDDSIELSKIDTEDQIGDIFTKGVTEILYCPLRNKLMGWDN